MVCGMRTAAEVRDAVLWSETAIPAVLWDEATAAGLVNPTIERPACTK